MGMDWLICRLAFLHCARALAGAQTDRAAARARGVGAAGWGVVLMQLFVALLDLANRHKSRSCADSRTVTRLSSLAHAPMGGAHSKTALPRGKIDGFGEEEMHCIGRP